MISLIICSRKTNVPRFFEKNVADTIGNIEYEIIWIENSDNKRSIFQAYNHGVKQAKYPYLCFMHEDIKFCSKNWGEEVIAKLSQPQTGLVGVIGGCYIGKTSLSWYIPRCNKGSIIQGRLEKGKYTTYNESFNDNVTNDNVVAVDGLWMCLRKELFEKGIIHWDEESYTGFHLYDLDICMQVNRAKLYIKIASDVTIEHSSLGTKTPDFYEAVLSFHRKWDDMLPIIAEGFELSQSFDEENLILREYCSLASENFKRIEKLSHWSHKIISKLFKL